MKFWILCLSIILIASCKNEQNSDIMIVVASSFDRTAQQLAKEFQSKHNKTVTVISSSSGKLHSQIQNGLPCDLFISASDLYSSDLIEKNIAVSSTPICEGKLILASNLPQVISIDAFIPNNNQHIAIPNPAIAPFGVAATEFLKHSTKSPPSIIKAESVAQTNHFFKSGSCDFALTSFSSIYTDPETFINYTAIPDSLSAPIAFQLVSIKVSENNKLLAIS